MQKNIYYLLVSFIVLTNLFPAELSAQTATTTVVYTGFQACGGCTICGADYWCFNTPGSYCGNTGPCGTQTFVDPCPAGMIVTSATLSYYTGDCAGGAINASIDGNAIPSVNEGNTGCLCSSNPCAVSASSSSNFPCGLPGYVNGGTNTLQLCTGNSVCVNKIVLTFTYAPANQATPATNPAVPSGPSPVCAGTAYTYSIPAVANASTYTWTVPAGWVINSGQGTTSITATPGGAGNVCVTAGNLCGQSAQICYPVTISTPSTPAVSASANPNPICSGNPTTLSLSGGSLGSGATWDWYSGSCGGTLVGTGTSVSVSPVTSTTYYVRASGTCNTTACVSVTVNMSSTPPPPGLPAGTASVCSGSTQVYTTTGSAGAVSYTWTVPAGSVINSGQGTTSISVTMGTTSGSVCVSAVGSCGTSSPSCTTLTVTTPPTAPVSVTGTTPVCPGAEAYSIASVAGATGYTWSLGASTGSITSGQGTTGINVNWPSAGKDTVFVTAGNACGTSAASTFIVTVNPIPVLTNVSTTQTVCSGTPTTLVTLTSSVTGTTFAWTATGSASASGYATSGTNTIPVQTIINSSSVTDTVVYSVTLTAAGCTASAPTHYLVIVNPIPTLSNASTNQTICSGASTTAVSLTSSVSGTTFAWTATGSATAAGYTTSGTSTIPVQTITNSGTGVDTVVYHVTLTANGCSAALPSDYLVFVNPVPRLSLAALNQVICSGASTAAVALTSTVTGTTFAWTATGPASASGFAASGTSSIPVQTIVNSGTVNDTIFYSVVLTANGCTAPVPSTYYVVVYPVTPSPVAVTPAAYCQGQPIAPLTATGTNIKWYSDAGLTILVGTGNSFNPGVSSTTTFYVTETVNGCRSGSATAVTITVKPRPSAAFTANPTVGTAPLTVTFSAGAGPVNYTWTFGNGSNGSGSDVNATYPVSGMFTVVCTATENGCTDSSFVIVDVQEHFTVTIPNVFTPNNDGQNDLFLVTGAGITNFSMEIYDRWGLQLYTSDRLNEGWNGRTSGGAELPAGTYYYIIKLKNINSGESKVYQSSLSLLR
ncbi:MAG: gliding motility-associated C-terminal domain-containing protein [Bacteroidia bacterium]